MNQIILASHGGMSAGVKDTIQMVFGDLPNLYAVATLRDETEPVSAAVRRLLQGFSPEDQVFILTDVLGGSVNNEMLSLLSEYPDLTIICGLNLSLALGLAVHHGPLTEEEIQEVISQAREQILNCSQMLLQAQTEQGDDL